MEIDQKISTREQLNQAAKEDYDKLKVNNSLYKIEDENGKPQFFLTSLQDETIKNKNSELGNGGFALDLIPNDISGNLMTANVIILNLNMGAGADHKDFYNFIKDCNKGENCFSPYTTEFGESKKQSSFSQTMFYEMLSNEKLKGTVDTILTENYSIIEAKDLYEKIKQCLQEIFNYEKNTKILSNALKDYGLNDDKKGKDTLNNFYRLVIIPLLQLKFPFEDELQISPIFIATDDYYTGIGEGKGSNKLHINRKVYNWYKKDENSAACTEYIFGDKEIPLLDDGNSLLANENLNVKYFNNIMLVQQFPYASNKSEKGITGKNSFIPWQNFVRHLLYDINNFNKYKVTEEKKISIIVNRGKANYLKDTFVQLTNTNIKYSTNPRAGYLTNRCFKNR